MAIRLKDTISGNSSTSSRLLTAINFKIGNTSRSFNGTADVTWTLSEIGAAASSHSHSNYASTISTTGSGNAVTAVSQSGNTITVTKGSTFSVSSHTHDYVTDMGKHTEVASGNTANAPTTGLAKGTTKGLYMTETYNDANTPSSYGNIINIAGSGTGQLLCEWSGSDTGVGHLYYRSHRDTSTGGWRPWITIVDSNNVGSLSCTRAEYNSIITRLNSIDSQLSGVSAALTSLEAAVK